MTRGERVALVVTALLLAVAAWQAARTPVRTDLSVFLPHAPALEQQLLIEQLRSGAAARLVLVAIEGGSAAERTAASRALAAALRDDPRFQQITNGDAAALQKDRALVFRERYLLSPAVDASRFTVDGLRAAIGETLQAASGPAGMAAASLLARDPTGETLQLVEALAPPMSPRRSDGVWVSHDGTRALLMVMLAAPLIESDAQQQALEALRAAFSPQPSAGLQLRISGPAAFAAESRSRIVAEVAWLSALSTGLVVLLLWLAYRSVRTLALGLVPVACGALVAYAAVGAAFGDIHGITLAFGIALIGEGVDYAIYLFVQADGDARGRWRTTLWPTLRLGVATSVVGYTVLLLSGFPGLAQLGLFAIVGVIVAAWVTRHVLPALLPAGFRLRDLAPLGERLDTVVRALGWRRGAWVALPCAAALAVLAIHAGAIWQRDLSALSPLSAEAQALDAALRADLGSADVRLIVAAPGADREQALEAAERAAQQLQPLVERGVLTHVDSPSRLLPSLAAQRARQAALPAADTLRSRLAEALAGTPLRSERLEGFIDDVARARSGPLLTPEALRGTSLGVGVQSLLLERADARDGEARWIALLPLHGPAAGIDAAAVRAALIDGSGGGNALLLDLKAATHGLYGDYLREASGLAGAAALAIVALLAASLRSAARLARVLLPLVAAVLCLTGALLAAGVRLTLLHLVGLLLVVAIGSNYSLLFERRSAAGRADARVLVSLLLAAATTIATFGVLAASSVPVLGMIGATVAPGVLLALIFSAALARPEP
jgi:predicted exporter